MEDIQAKIIDKWGTCGDANYEENRLKLCQEYLQVAHENGEPTTLVVWDPYRHKWDDCTGIPHLLRRYQLDLPIADEVYTWKGMESEETDPQKYGGSYTSKPVGGIATMREIFGMGPPTDKGEQYLRIDSKGECSVFYKARPGMEPVEGQEGYVAPEIDEAVEEVAVEEVAE